MLSSKLLARSNKTKNEKLIKIASPISKYSDGDLLCIICNTKVKSAAIWKVHINSKSHREKLDLTKQLNCTLKEKQNALSTNHDNRKIFSTVQGASKSPKMEVTEVNSKEIVDVNLPDNFFDKVVENATEDTKEEEWQKFKYEIQEETLMSNNLILEEQEKINNQKELGEIDEQMLQWKKVIKLNEKKQKALTNACQKVIHQLNVADSSDEDDNFSVLSNWRSKKII